MSGFMTHGGGMGCDAMSMQDVMNRRLFVKRSGLGLGWLAMRGLLGAVEGRADRGSEGTGLGSYSAYSPRARRVIYLHQSGAPSQVDLFDYKPGLVAMRGKELPESVRMGQRLTGMTSGYGRLPLYPSAFRFGQHGRSGVWMSELLPHLSKVADELAVVRTMYTEAINHDPAITFVHTGSQIAGRPSFGSWVSYGLGSENRDFPAFVVLTSNGTGRPDDQPLYDRLWSSGFLPSQHQGVRFRTEGGDPVLFLSDPPGVSRESRRAMLDGVVAMNRVRWEGNGDPEVGTRIRQYEMAFRMQASVPEFADLKGEPESVMGLYGPEVKRAGSFAANCLLARRLAERGVRFIQLYHRGWDQHFSLEKQIRGQCGDVDQACYGLLTDLRQRGLLEDTLVVWGGEFGRTVYGQGDIDSPRIGRDHHPRCFSIWLAGGGVRAGTVYGETDEFSYNVVRDPVSFYDLNATLMYLLGVEHTRLTHRIQGRDYRLTDVHGRKVDGLVG